MRIFVWLSAVAGLLLTSASTVQANIIRVEQVSTDVVALPGPREITVGVYLDVGVQDLVLGAYDIPLDFGAAGITSLPSGFTFVGVQDSIFTQQSTLGFIVDPTGLGDRVVQDVPVPPSGVAAIYQPVTAGTSARLFNLRFGLDDTVSPGSGFTIAPFLPGQHPFFNLNDSSAAPITVSSGVTGGLQAIPEPNSTLALGLLSGLLSMVRRGRRR